MTKRQKFVIASFIIFFGIILSRLGLGHYLQWRARVAIFALVAFLATFWALKDEDFSGLEWLTLPILPVMFAVGAASVYPLLPSHFDTILGAAVTLDTSWLLIFIMKMIFLTLVLVGYYATVLTANIFNVAAIRNIQLLRVAHSIGFLMTVATALLFFIVIFSLHLSGLLNFLLVSLVSLPLSFQAIWSIALEEKVGERTKNYSLATPVILGEVAWILSFWPISISIMAIFLTAIFYEMVGIIQYHFDSRLNSRVVNEFVLVATVVFLITLLTAQWGT
jgi:hypothetical protein